MKFPKKLLRGKLTFGKLIAVLLIWLAWVGVSHFAGNADFGTAPLELDTIPAAHAESGITGGKIRICSWNVNNYSVANRYVNGK